MIKDNRTPLFETGKIVATPTAVKVMEQLRIEPSQLLDRHIRGDYGDIDDEDHQANEDAIEEGCRILSAYKFGKHTLWVITEADRSSTRILLPSEY